MTQTYILIDTDARVVNAVLWDGDAAGWQPPPGLSAVPYSGPWQVGWRWNGMEAVDPNPASQVSPQPRVDTTPKSGAGMSLI